MKIIKTILLFIFAISSTSAFLGGIFATITILGTANFVSGKAIVIGICMLLIFLFGLFAILCYKKLYLLYHIKQKEPLDNMIVPSSPERMLEAHTMQNCFAIPENTSNHTESPTSTSDSHVESESVVSKSDEPQNMQYVETGNIVYRTDGKSITDEEIPYLIRNGQAAATAKWKVPNLIRQITESYQIICQTNDPETLCTRYNFIVDKINELARFEQQGLLDKNIFSQYESLITDDNHYKLISSCYHKYKIKAQSELKTQNGINKRIDKFWEIIRNNVSSDFYNTDWIH